jgi:hypothetical protein
VTLTDVLIEAVADELSRRRLWLDSTEGLRGVTVMVKLKPSGEVRAIIVNQETETSRNGSAT